MWACENDIIPTIFTRKPAIDTTYEAGMRERVLGGEVIGERVVERHSEGRGKSIRLRLWGRVQRRDSSGERTK